MFGRAFGVIQILNIVIQSIFTLLIQIAIAILIGWLCVDKWGAPDWVYVPVILLGVGSGIVSMVRFLLAASRSVERIEQQRNEKYKHAKGHTQQEKQRNGD